MHNKHQLTIADIEQQLQKGRSKDKRIVLLNQLAVQLKDQDMQRAVQYAEQVRTIAEEERERKQSKQQLQFYTLHLAKALHTLAFCLRTTSRVQEAEKYALRAIALYKELGEQEQVAFVQYHTGFLYWLYHRYQDALNMFQNAITTFQNVGNIRYYHNAKTSMSNTLFRLGKYDEAEQHLLESIHYARSNNLELDLSVALVNLGNLYEDKSQLDKALICYKESIELLRRIGPPMNLAGALTGIAGICKILGNISEAIAYNNEALSIYNQSGSITGAATVMEGLSGIYLHQGEFNKSISIALTIIEMLEGTEYKRILAGAYNNIASVYIAQHNYLKSTEYFTKAREIYTQINDVRGICFTNSNIAEVLSENNQWQEALPYVTTAWNIAVESEFLDLEIEIAPVYGKIISVLQNDSLALTMYNTTFTKCTHLKHKRGAMLLSALIGGIYMRTGYLNDAEQQYLYSLRTAEEIDEKQQVMNAHKLLAELYEQHNANTQALKHFKEYHNIERLLYNEQSSKRISYLQVLHETEKAEKERDLFRLENEKLQSENEFKSKELSAMALHLVQKNEMLDTLRTKARAIVESYAEKSRQIAIEMVQQIESNIRDDNSWESFNQQFTQLHSGFAHTLSERYPNLTPMELKICALLKIQLSTKEIATALVLSARTVEDHRNRMRKKFGLSKEENLATFLASL